MANNSHVKGKRPRNCLGDLLAGKTQVDTFEDVVETDKEHEDLRRLGDGQDLLVRNDFRAGSLFYDSCKAFYPLVNLSVEGKGA